MQVVVDKAVGGEQAALADLAPGSTVEVSLSLSLQMHTSNSRKHFQVHPSRLVLSIPAYDSAE